MAVILHLWATPFIYWCTHTRSHNIQTHTHTDIYNYIYVCVYVFMYVYECVCGSRRLWRDVFGERQSENNSVGINQQTKGKKVIQIDVIIFVKAIPKKNYEIHGQKIELILSYSLSRFFENFTSFRHRFHPSKQDSLSKTFQLTQVAVNRSSLQDGSLY